MTATALKRLRSKLELTQEELAALLAIPRNTYARWEMGFYPVPPMAVRLLEYIKAERAAKKIDG